MVLLEAFVVITGRAYRCVKKLTVWHSGVEKLKSRNVRHEARDKRRHSFRIISMPSFCDKRFPQVLVYWPDWPGANRNLPRQAEFILIGRGDVRLQRCHKSS